MTPADSPRPRLSVVIPAYNEQDSLGETVDAIIGAVPDPGRCELVIVNDGSTDKTLAVANDIAAKCAARVVVVDRPTNGGMGQALASGFERVTGEAITWIPGDGEYDLGEVLVGLDKLAGCDIVLVNRIARGQLGRNIVSTIMYGLIRVLFGFDAHGYCGIFVISNTRWQELTIRLATCSSPRSCTADQAQPRVNAATTSWPSGGHVRPADRRCSGSR